MIYMILNTMIFGIITPELDDIANETSFVDYDRWQSRTAVIKTGFNIALFIFALIPYAYLFTRLLLKKEQQAQPAYYSPGGGW
jgi:hypothetical protein